MSQRTAGRASPAAPSAERRQDVRLQMSRRDEPRLPGAQRGVALVVALILLVVITLIGLAAVSGTIMQSKMAANQYDRQTAFQNAASALRVAQAQLEGGNYADVSSRTCSADPAGDVCLSNPFTDPNLPAGSIYPVAAGTAAGQYTAADLATGQPQFVIEDMGNWIDPGSNVGCAHNVNAQQGGGGQVCDAGKAVTYYRITARSGDPTTVGDRAVVTLQAVVKKF